MKRKYTFLPIILIICLLTSCSRSTAGSDPAGTAAGTSAQSGSASGTSSLSGSAKTPCSSHVDADNNGLCDVCDTSVVFMLDFYAINDLHGKFADSPEQPGVDELTTYFKERFCTDDYPILLSSGDMWQGSSESNLTRGGIMIDWMNELGFSAMTLGNHEFDWGTETISGNSALADFPFLAINIFDEASGERVSFATPSLLIDYGDIQVGIIGAIGDCYSSISGDRSGGIRFATGRELTNLVKAESEKLRAEGADFIVYSIHDGLECSHTNGRLLADSKFAGIYDVELSNGYVDLVFEGHTHYSYVVTDRYGVYHLQDGGENDGISHAAVTVNTVSGAAPIVSAEFVPSYKYSDRSSDPVRDELLDQYSDTIAFVNDVLGRTDSVLDRNELRTIVARLYYDAGESKWGDRYDLVLGGGFMSARSPGYLAAGDITYSDIQSVFPFDNELVLCSVSGADLKRVFFDSRNSNYFMYYSEYGLSVMDSPDPLATYYVVTDTYSSTYAPNNLTEIERYGEEYYARDMLADFFRNK